MISGLLPFCMYGFARDPRPYIVRVTTLLCHEMAHKDEGCMEILVEVFFSGLQVCWFCKPRKSFMGHPWLQLRSLVRQTLMMFISVFACPYVHGAPGCSSLRFLSLVGGWWVWPLPCPGVYGESDSNCFSKASWWSFSFILWCSNQFLVGVLLLQIGDTRNSL